MPTTKVNNTNLYYELHGNPNKQPLVLIAGFSCDHTFWTGLLSQLIQDYQVLLFDNRGIGQSDSPQITYSIDDMADDTIALIQKLNLKSPILIGQSMGSAIAQNMAKRYPQQISKIILINTFAKIAKKAQIAFELTGELHRMNVPISYRVCSIAGWVYSNVFLSQPNQLKNLINFAENNPYPQTLIGYDGQLQALKNFQSSTWLTDIKIPTLIIAAEEDILAPLSAAMEVHERIGDYSKLVIIPGGHASPIEQPKSVIAAILPFC